MYSTSHSLAEEIFSSCPFYHKFITLMETCLVPLFVYSQACLKRVYRHFLSLLFY
ncbi:hypothetical protein NEOC84_001525|nr:hypothetical protein [Neochlamydia sp. AcF95]NGY95603.1 hypothetical protein [Neochlamydia sp. AcF84]